MKTLRIAALLGLVIFTVFPLHSNGRESDRAKFVKRFSSGPFIPMPLERVQQQAFESGVLRAATYNDTTELAFFDFGYQCDPQGWTSHDISWEPAYFHVDDFAGLGGGTFQRLHPIEGDQSMWCGARPSSDEELCGYAALPGYGNEWHQMFCTDACLAVTGDVTVDYIAVWDTETDYDYVYLEFDECDNNWRGFDPPVAYTDVDTSFESHSIADTLHSGEVRVRFYFVSDDYWSDEDALYNTDGAIIIDSLTVRDASGIVVPTELFEDEAVGDTEADGWAACNTPPYGDYAAMYAGVNLVQEDPCWWNPTCMWAFISGSTYNYACSGYPAQAVIPYGDANGQYIWNEVWSPPIPWTGSGTVAELSFDMYSDLEASAGIFHKWHVRSRVGDCWGPWQSDFYIWYNITGIPDWLRWTHPFGHFVTPGATHIQVAVGVVDGARWGWGGECHSHAPLYDNVCVYRIDSNAPQFTVVRSWLFGDNFPSDGTITGTVRADAGVDWSEDPLILEYADAALLWISSPLGLAPDPHTGFGAAAYTYVSVRPQNQPGKMGQELLDDAFRWPVVDSTVIDGSKWYQIRMDTMFTDPVNRLEPWADVFGIDLNDNLFTPGDTVYYFFAAQNAAPSLEFYYWTLRGTTNGVVTDDLATAAATAMEFTCLPAGGYRRGGDILLVAPVRQRANRLKLFEAALQQLNLDDKVDRFDTEFFPGNSWYLSLGGRVTDLYQQLIPCYRKIIWLGELPSGSDTKTDDFGMLHAFLNSHTEKAGVYLTGDDVAQVWADRTDASSIDFKSVFMEFNLVSVDHNVTGLPISPLVVGEPGSCFDHTLGPDTLIAFGGCPNVNSFDVIAAAGTSAKLASYRGNGIDLGAIVGQKTENSLGNDVGVMLSGFGFEFIRDDRPAGVLERSHHLHDILTWMENVVAQPVGTGEVAYRNTLSQNYPNPFNPVTTISFTVKEKAPVSLRIYNVAGQLVRTLVDDTRAPGVVHRFDWDGRNEAGQAVSSGVYFYKLVAKDFTQTRKMVLLK
jgi:hypothetical protein